MTNDQTAGRHILWFAGQNFGVFVINLEKQL